jgi:hypothetical protein
MSYQEKNIETLCKSTAPSFYEAIDFSKTPERYRTPDESSIKPGYFFNKEFLSTLIKDKKELELFRQLTLMGDPIADAFAIKVKETGITASRKLLDDVFKYGIDHTEGVPSELRALIETMKKPSSLNKTLIEETGENFRLSTAVFQQYIMRFAFMMTYINGYQGLPMLHTGSLTGENAGKRILNTNSIFLKLALPDALEEDSDAFKAAVNVRIMHALVRTNLFSRPNDWDKSIYGTPIPQVDQLGASLIIPFFVISLSKKFNFKLNKTNRGNIERFKYLANLLGLHSYFLKHDNEFLKPWAYLQLTLRHKIDPKSANLNRATLNAYLKPSRSLLNRITHKIDIANTRAIYTASFGKELSEKMGVKKKRGDTLLCIILIISLSIKMVSLKLLKIILPNGKQLIDQWSINKINSILSDIGNPSHETNEKNYAVEKNNSHEQ